MIIFIGYFVKQKSLVSLRLRELYIDLPMSDHIRRILARKPRSRERARSMRIRAKQMEVEKIIRESTRYFDTQVSGVKREKEC